MLRTKPKSLAGTLGLVLLKGFFGWGSFYVDFRGKVGANEGEYSRLWKLARTQMRVEIRQTTCKTNCTVRHESQGAIVFLKSINPLRLVAGER